MHVVELLAAAPGVDVNRACNNGETPLCVALSRGHADVARVLRAAGAAEISDDDGDDDEDEDEEDDGDGAGAAAAAADDDDTNEDSEDGEARGDGHGQAKRRRVLMTLGGRVVGR